MEVNETQIKNRYRGLLKSCRNSVSPEDLKLIRKAYGEVVSIYDRKKSSNGEPYYIHLVNVARICAEEIGLGATSVIAALLQSTINDKVFTRQDIEREYNSSVANIVESLSKMSMIDSKNPLKQVESFRELMLALSSDARAILVKLAERLDTIRWMSNTPNEYQRKVSWESLNLYAPLAHRLGLYRVKSEMEDLAMKYTNPQDYHYIIKKLRNTATQRNRITRDFMVPIEEELRSRGFDFEIKGRPKSVYSIWKKMQKQGVAFNRVYDLFAIRVVLNTPPEREKSDCWQIYSIITESWTPNPERLRDWISVPKSNGYESLHTTVVGPEGRWVEVQIRSRRMDEIAEKGLAAHWKYKGIKQDKGLDQWVSKVREILEAAETAAEDLVEQFQLNLYKKEVFAFTPTGDLKKLPHGATVLDFAFEIHSDVGCQCVGAKINGRSVPIKHTLSNGDVVEIKTSKNQKPKDEWLKIVITGKAKAKIKQKLREEKNKALLVGKEMIFRRFKNWKVDDTEKSLKILQKHLKLKNSAQLFEVISSEKVNLSDLKQVVLSGKEEQPVEHVETSKPKLAEEKEVHRPDYLIIDEKLANIDFKLAKCCKPIHGDDIFGFVTIKDGIKIHRTNCPNARLLYQKYGYRIVNAKWKEAKDQTSFQTTVRITGIDELGMVNKISEVISKDLKVNMRSFTISSQNGMFEGKIQLFVSDVKSLDMLLYKLSKIKGVQRAVRIGGH